MFTGIVEGIATVVAVERDKGNYHFTLKTPIARELRVDQSLAHDGTCLTVVKVDHDAETYVVTAIQETIDKTNLGSWQPGYEVNLERSMVSGGRFDGHIVQGHVDQTAECIALEETDGSWRYTFRYDTSAGNFTVSKGSISVNGVSLTVVDPGKDHFSVAIIPYTYEVTNFHNFRPGTVVNLEFDILGKYVARLLAEHFGGQGN